MEVMKQRVVKVVEEEEEQIVEESLQTIATSESSMQTNATGSLNGGGGGAAAEDRGTKRITGDTKLDATVERPLSTVTNRQNRKSLKNTYESLSSVNLRPSEMSHEEQITSFERENAKLNLVNKNEEEIKLDLERLVEKPNTHDFYCPNCNACIQRVILREREREEERCTSCLGILILIGSIFKGKEPVDGRVKPGLGQGNILPEVPTDGVMRLGLSQGSIFKGKEPNVGRVEPRLGQGNKLPEIPTVNVVEPGLWQVESENGQGNRLPEIPTDGIVQQGLLEGGISPVGQKIAVGTVKSETEQGNILPKIPKNGVVRLGIWQGESRTREENNLPEIPIGGVMGPGLWEGGISSGGQKIGAGTVESETGQSNISPEIPTDGVVRPGIWQGGISLGGEQTTVGTGSKKLDILKCTIYGGLTESITSLSVVISAASADATTLNILALGLANLIGGLFVIGHNIRELKNDTYKKLKNDDSGDLEASNQNNEQVDRYEELLGQRENFWLHATVVVLSFLVFGLVPLVTYGFSFLKSDNSYLKLAAVVPASVLCIALLAIGKAYIKRPTKFSSYIKTVLYYVSAALAVSGVSYIVGDLIKKVLEKLGWFESSVFVTLPIAESRMAKPAWGSY